MAGVSVTLLNVGEIAAVAAFGYSGAEVARRHGMDIVGLVALAVVNGLAGGVTRDVLIGRPVLALNDTRLLPTCLFGALVVMVFGSVMPVSRRRYPRRDRAGPVHRARQRAVRWTPGSPNSPRCCSVP